jgi:hypothetical protein
MKGDCAGSEVFDRTAGCLSDETRARTCCVGIDEISVQRWLSLNFVQRKA